MFFPSPRVSGTRRSDVFSLLIGTAQLQVIGTGFHQNAYGGVHIFLLRGGAGVRNRWYIPSGYVKIAIENGHL